MGFFDSMKANSKGNAAYKAHVEANKASDQGKLAEATAKYQEAMALYEEAYKLGTNRANTLHGYSVLLMREGQFEKAREVMLHIEKMPGLTGDDWYRLRLNFSVYQWRTGMLDKAIDTARRASGTHMTSSVYTTLGMYLVDKARETGDFEEALKFNLEAVEYDEEDPGAQDNLGQLYEAMAVASAEKGDMEEANEYHKKARKALEKAHEVRPRQITTLYYLARVYLAEGRPEKAKEMFKDLDNLYFSQMCPVDKDMMMAMANKTEEMQQK